MYLIKLNHNAEKGTFEAENETKHQININAGTSNETGEINGFRPTELLLVALGGCMGIDVLMITKKQRLTIDDLKIEVSGERDYEQEPAVFKTMNIHLIFKGDNLSEKKIEKAIDLSYQKYCTVSAILGKSATISTSYKIE